MKRMAILLACFPVLAAPAQAQRCFGFSAPERGLYLGGRADFPQNAHSYGAEADYNVAGPLGLYAGLDVVSDGKESTNDYHLGAAFEIVSLGAQIGPHVSICPVVEVSWASQNDFSIIQLPIGLGIGTDVRTSIGGVEPFAIGQIVHTRLDVPDARTDFSDFVNTRVGFRAGVNVTRNKFLLGGQVQHVFGFGSDPTFAVRAGLRL
jgi:hypothetical protein